MDFSGTRGFFRPEPFQDGIGSLAGFGPRPMGPQGPLPSFDFGFDPFGRPEGDPRGLTAPQQEPYSFNGGWTQQGPPRMFNWGGPEAQPQPDFQAHLERVKGIQEPLAPQPQTPPPAPKQPQQQRASGGLVGRRTAGSGGYFGGI
jgi:hypothetical protein